MTLQKKAGRPRRGEARESLAMLNFRASEETLQALAEIEASMGPGILNPRSAAIRRAIHQTAERLRAAPTIDAPVASPSPTSERHSAVPVGADLGAIVLDVVRKRADGPHEGLASDVDVPALRAAVGARASWATRAAIDEALLALEADARVVLTPKQSLLPLKVDPEDTLRVDGREPMYHVILCRDPRLAVPPAVSTTGKPRTTAKAAPTRRRTANAKPGTAEWRARVFPVDGLENLKQTIARHVAELDAAHHGLVPLPELRRVLRERYTPLLTTDVDRALVELERERRVELRIAQSPATVPDRADGIVLDGRGLVFWVAPKAT